MKLIHALLLSMAAALLAALGAANAHYPPPPPPSAAVVATPATATLSRTGVANYAAYSVTISNPTRSALKSLQFKATTTVSPAGTVARFFSSSGLATPCTATNSDGTAIRCSLGASIPAGGSLSFTLVFSTPTAGSTIRLDTLTTFCGDDSRTNQSLQASATTTLAAPSPDAFSTYVPATGATFFTGTGSTPSATTADPWTTTVTVPPGTPTTASVQESVDPNSCSADLLTCNISSITAPGSFDHLVIILRRDVSTIVKSSGHGGHGGWDDHDDHHAPYSKTKGGDDDHDHDHGGYPGHDSREPKIENAVISYEHVLGAGFVPVPNCSDDPSLNLPQPGRPCIKSRTAYPKKAPTPAVDQGDWQFEIWAVDNGRYQG